MQSILLHPTIRTQSFHSWLSCAALLLFTFLLSPSVKAQEKCGVESHNHEAFEKWLAKRIRYKKQNQAQKALLPPIYEIPVVVHIINPLSGDLNISDERITRQIEILTEDFRRQNADASNTPAAFLPVASDTEIQFSLARQDPAGNPTNGIVRVQGSKGSYHARLDKDLLRSESFWPSAHYLNIYVANLQSPFFGIASQPMSTLPGVINDLEDYYFEGIIIHHEYFGENPTAPDFESFGRTTTHEVGHYFGLRHIWGDGPCDVDDFVDDTPPADQNNGGLSSPCTFPSDDSNVCVTDEMFQNYMDYTDDVCMNLFTTGQATRMRTVLENSPRRTTLITSPGLNEPIREPNTLAITKIVVPSEVECVNPLVPSVIVSNHGNNAVSSYELQLWVNGDQEQSMMITTSLEVDESEMIILNPQLISDLPASVNFVITDVNGINSESFVKNVTISNASSISLPFNDDLESEVEMLGEIDSSAPWEVTTAQDELATNQALVFKAYQNTSAFGEAATLRTPVFDLTGLNSAELAFSYAHADVPDAFQDGLAVKVSTDCGQTFSDDFVFNAYGPDLATADATADAYLPEDATHWEDTTINITAFAGIDGVQFAFVGQNGSGNNIYLDNISVVQTNLLANDLSIVEIEGPLITCKTSSSLEMRVRNVGFQTISTINYAYTIDGITSQGSANNLSIESGSYYNIEIDVNTPDGVTDIDFEVSEINGITDQDLSNNALSYSFNKSNAFDSYPFIVDFETANLWEAASLSADQLWSTTNVGSNGVLIASGFSSTTTGTQSWFISPSLDVGTLDSAGLSFKASYGQKQGFNDALQVLMSVNCGESYPFELLNVSSTDLATAQSETSWIPNFEEDWKTFNIDLKASIIWKDEIRLAFVFTNGNGNNLYIDDIQVGNNPDPQNSSSLFKLFPNPAKEKFNVAFSLPERDDILLQIVDVSGKVIFERAYKNVLDQVYDFDTHSEFGLYFVKISSDKIDHTERLYIRH